MKVADLTRVLESLPSDALVVVRNQLGSEVEANNVECATRQMRQQRTSFQTSVDVIPTGRDFIQAEVELIT